MTAGDGVAPWFFLDRDSAELVAVPGLLGIDGGCTVALLRAEEVLESHELGVGEVARVQLPVSASVADLTLRVTGSDPTAGQEADEAWEMERLGPVSVTEIVPAEWGVDEECIAVLRDSASRRVIYRALVPAGGSTRCAHGGKPLLVLNFHRPLGEGLRLGARLGTLHRWVPSADEPSLEPEDDNQGAGLTLTRRQQVDLAPAVQPLTSRTGMLSTRGYIGVWVDRRPVLEAMDYALGAQYYRVLPHRPPTRHESGTAIYLGPPRNGWGHFLTQGLARLWYAFEHPELPVIWDGKLKPFQRQVLELLGLQNEQRELVRPQSWDEIIFPYPGCCIGEFVLPAWTTAIGRVRPSATVEGKRLFLSRSALSKDAEHKLDLRLDEVAEKHGFTVFRPEQHPIAEQLAELSSAEAVLAVEGSALHTPLLLAGPLPTTFWALTRHRGGSGVFEHIRQAKGLRYETLNYLRTNRRGHRDPMDLDVEALDHDLTRTNGLRTDLHQLAERIEHPWPGQTTYRRHLRSTEIGLDEDEEAMLEALLALRRKDYRQVSRLIASRL